MSTKNNPGAFRCYEAALPDEPIFTILARDPAGPATLRYWVYQRGKNHKADTIEDIDRIEDANRVAAEMESWRNANADAGPDGQPAWRNVGVTDELGGPIRVEPDNTVYVYAERDGDEAVRLSIDWLQARCRDLVSGLITRKHFADLMDLACKSPDRRRERVVPVEEAAYDAAARDARSITMANAITSAITMLDGSNVTGCKLTIDAIRQTLFNGLQDAPVMFASNLGERKVGMVPELGMGYSPVVDTQPTKVSDAFVSNVRQLLELTKDEVWMGKLGRLWRALWNETSRFLADEPVSDWPEEASARAAHIVDSQPTDLAHNPEVPPHRFSTFHKGERYAYARGLEINPIHLPTALDAMAQDGWNLLAIFGQTDSEHVGFIFERRPEPVMLAAPRDLTREAILAADDREPFVVEYVTREPDGSCATHRTPIAHWPVWAQPCDDRGRGMEP